MASSSSAPLVVVRTDHSFKSRVSEHVAAYHGGVLEEAASLQYVALIALITLIALPLPQHITTTGALCRTR